MAQVYRARRRGPMGFTKEVAIKRLRYASEGPDRKLIESLINEARISGRLRHPRIVEVFEFDEVDGDFFLAMEYVHGWTLDRVMWRIHEAGELIPAGSVIDAARQMADSLAYAHSAVDDDGHSLGLVHRDLKPQNLFLDRTGAIKIADFGLAKSTQNLSQTRSTEGAKGSPLYMSPEQIAGRSLDGRSDLFAVGVVLVEMATGIRAFEGNSIPNTLLRVLQCDAGEALEAMRELVPQLHPVISRLLRRSPADRYPSARELLAELDEIANHEPLGLHTRALVAALVDEERPGVPQRVQEHYGALRLALREAGQSARDPSPGDGDSIDLDAESVPGINQLGIKKGAAPPVEAVLPTRAPAQAQTGPETDDALSPDRGVFGLTTRAPGPDAVSRDAPTKEMPGGRPRRVEAVPPAQRPPPPLPIRVVPAGPAAAVGLVAPPLQVNPHAPTLQQPVVGPAATPAADPQAPTPPGPTPQGVVNDGDPTRVYLQPSPAQVSRPPVATPTVAGSELRGPSARRGMDAGWGRVYALLGVAVGLSAFLLILLQLSPRPEEREDSGFPDPVAEGAPDVPAAPRELVEVIPPPLGHLWQDLPVRAKITAPGTYGITCHYRARVPDGSGPWRRVVLEQGEGGQYEVSIPLTATFGSGVLYYLEVDRTDVPGHWLVGSSIRPMSAEVR